MRSALRRDPRRVVERLHCKIAEPLGDRLGALLRRYHFAAPARVDTRSLDGASIASGEGIRASALDDAAGYTALAGGGLYHAPDALGR